METGSETLLEDRARYPVLGWFIDVCYLANTVRPDINVHFGCWPNMEQSPITSHLHAAEIVPTYLGIAWNLGFIYGNAGAVDLHAFIEDECICWVLGHS